MIKLASILKNIFLENVKSSEFEQWFRGSKIVDSSGNPLRVYHGTNKNYSSDPNITKETLA